MTTNPSQTAEEQGFDSWEAAQRLSAGAHKREGVAAGIPGGSPSEASFSMIVHERAYTVIVRPQRYYDDEPLEQLSHDELIAKIRTASALYGSQGVKLDAAMALVKDLRQFIPYEKPEQGPLPMWIVRIKDRVEGLLR